MSMYVPICDYSEPNSRLSCLNANVRADAIDVVISDILEDDTDI